MVDGPAETSYVAGSSDANALLVIICSALSGYNALEVILLLFTTFSLYRGLYFWSLLVASVAILPYAIGLCFFYFELTAKLVGYIINNIGWWFMVTGQSVVLYSRLGVVLGKCYENILTFVKWMIIIDAIVFHSMATVVTFCRYYAPDRSPFDRAYRYIEKIQMTAFCLQEFTISGIYLWRTTDILKTSERKTARRVMWQLFAINVIIIVIDIALLVLEYRNLFIPEVSFKTLAYSIKLKLEFAILGKLVSISHDQSRYPSLVDTYSADTKNLPPSRIDALGAASLPTLVTASDVTRPRNNGCVSRTQLELQQTIQVMDTIDHAEPATSLPTHYKSGHAICTTKELTVVDSKLESADMMYADAMRVLSR